MNDHDEWLDEILHEKILDGGNDVEEKKSQMKETREWYLEIGVWILRLNFSDGKIKETKSSYGGVGGFW